MCGETKANKARNIKKIKKKDIVQYEDEIIRLKGQGFTNRQIGAMFDLSKEQIKEHVHRCNVLLRSMGEDILPHCQDTRLYVDVERQSNLIKEYKKNSKKMRYMKMQEAIKSKKEKKS